MLSHRNLWRKILFICILIAAAIFQFSTSDKSTKSPATRTIASLQEPPETESGEDKDEDDSRTLSGEAVAVETDTPPYGGLPIQLVYNAQTESAACGAYDLRDTDIGANRSLPARRYQGSSGWCYAMVLSDLLSLHLRSSVSPADIAITNLNRIMNTQIRNFNSRDPQYTILQALPLGGGVITDTISYLNNRGVCLEEDFSINLNNDNDEGDAADNKNTETPNINIAGLLRFFTAENREGARQLLTAIQHADFISALNELAEAPVCTPRFTDLNVQLDIDSHFDRDSTPESPPPSRAQREQFWNRLNSALGPGKIVAISYLPEILTQTPREHLRDNVPMGIHMSSIVGRRYNAEKTRCEYLVRNTERECNEYLSDYDCRDNHVWVPRQAVQLGVSHYLKIPSN